MTIVVTACTTYPFAITLVLHVTMAMECYYLQSVYHLKYFFDAGDGLVLIKCSGGTKLITLETVNLPVAYPTCRFLFGQMRFCFPVVLSILS